jgi:flagellar motility protein MotE (MotC chaperone)
MPAMFGKDSKKKEMIHSLQSVYELIQKEHQISLGDFPNLKRMQELLEKEDFTKFHALKPKLIETVDQMLRDDIARLMAMIPHEEQVRP